MDFRGAAQGLDRGLDPQVGAADADGDDRLAGRKAFADFFKSSNCFCASKGRLIQPRKSDPVRFYEQGLQGVQSLGPGAFRSDSDTRSEM